MSMCRVFSSVIGRGCLLWPVRSLGKTLLAFALFILYSKAKFACYSRCFLTSYFCIPVPYNEKGHLFWVLVLKCLVGLHRTIQLQLLQHYWLYRLGLPWYWMLWLGNEQRFFEIVPKYCILDSFVDYDGYSMSSKGFLYTVVNVLVIWVKFPIPVHFSSLIPRMSMFTLTISCLTTSNLPWLMDLTFQVLMQYCSLQHWTLFPSPVTSTTGCCFTFALSLRSFWS